MKKILSGFALVLMTLTLLVGCEKEYSQETGGQFGGAQGSFRAQIDGEQWIATQVKSASRQNGVILLVGSSGDGQSITLRVVDSGVHNYQLQNTSDNRGFYMDSTIVPLAEFGTDQWLTDSTYGNINITAIDTIRKTISGNFQMKVFRQLDGLKRTITNGEFTNISYGPPATNPPPAGADTFKVKVNNVDFVSSNVMAMSAMGSLLINATSNAGESVGLTFSETITPGTYQIDMISAQGTYSSGSTIAMAESGTLTILEHNTSTNRIRGNFSFVADDVMTPLPVPYQLTEGYFALSY